MILLQALQALFANCKSRACSRLSRQPLSCTCIKKGEWVLVVTSAAIKARQRHTHRLACFSGHTDSQPAQLDRVEVFLNQCYFSFFLFCLITNLSLFQKRRVILLLHYECISDAFRRGAHVELLDYRNWQGANVVLQLMLYLKYSFWSQFNLPQVSNAFKRVSPKKKKKK